LAGRVPVASQVGSILETAVELSAKEVRDNPSHYSFLLQDGARGAFIELLGDNKVAVFVFDHSHEVA